MVSHFENAIMEYEDHARALAERDSKIITKYRDGKTFYISRDVSERIHMLLNPNPNETADFMASVEVALDGELMPEETHSEKE